MHTNFHFPHSISMIPFTNYKCVQMCLAYQMYNLTVTGNNSFLT